MLDCKPTSSRLGLAFFQERQQVPLRNAPALTGALDLAQVDVLFLGNFGYNRRDESQLPVAVQWVWQGRLAAVRYPADQLASNGKGPVALLSDLRLAAAINASGAANAHRRSFCDQDI